MVAMLQLGCDAEEANAQLVLYNCLGFDNPATCSGGAGASINHFGLNGEEDTGNLLQSGQVVVPGQMLDLTDKVVPGKYTWHIKYEAGSSLADHYDSPVEVELFPGRNNIRLIEGSGGFL
ncbi:MAG: hypothetical protein JRF63_02000 [Deltaproteobacteria bacterium]|nr:hypothetical protein [Deltaproteobacteria bacterium]